MAGQAPLVSSITPSSGTTAGGTAVTIGGLHFQDGPLLLVLIGGVDVTASAVVVSDIAITAVTAAHVAGTVDIDVTTTIGSGLGNQLYTYTAGGSPVATVKSVELTALEAGTIQDGRIINGSVRHEGGKYTAATLASGSVIQFCKVKAGDILSDYTIGCAALGTVTADFGYHASGNDTSADDADLLGTGVSLASKAIFKPQLSTGVASTAIGYQFPFDGYLDCTTAGAGTATGEVKLMVQLSRMP